MRTYLTISTAAMIWFAAVPAEAQLGAPVELLTNGGFEDGVQGWSADAQHELVADSDAAHSGRACLTGEVTGPNQALWLRRNISVKFGNRYDFTIWARGTNRTKLVLWITQPGSQQREMVASWQNLTPKWRAYRTPIVAARTGELKLQIIAPSSHGAPAGRIWVDDITVRETTMPPAVCVSQKKGFSDEPAMAVASDGSVYVAFNRFQDGADSLQVARYQSAGDKLECAGQWQVVGGSGTYLLGLTAVATGRTVSFLYSAEVNKNWEVHAVQCGPAGPTKPLVVTRDSAVDIKPAGAWHDGTLWVAWETNRLPRRQIFATSVRDGAVAPPEALSPVGISSYDPTVTVLDNGEACVAWYSFQDNNYDVHLRRRAVDGAWGPDRRLTTAASIDRHPVLLARGRELWLVYENAQTERYYVTRTNHRHLVVAQVTDHGLLAPVTKGPSPLQQRCEGASAAFDQRGRLWLAMLKPHLPRAGWDVFLTTYAGGRWLNPVPVSGSKGMDRTPPLALLANQVLVAYQADDTPQSWSDLDHMADAVSDIFLASVDLADVPGDGTMSLEPLVESEDAFEPADIRLARGEDTATESIQYHNQTLQLYYGDLHEHSDVSVCNRVGDQSLDESYQHMRDLARHDFVCITDHGYNINPYLWNYSAKLARVNDDPGRFLTFLGQEWTSTFEEYSKEHPYGFYGHRNLILADLYFPTWWNARNRQTPTQVWEDLRRQHANFVHIPHQLADTGNVPTDWSFHDEVAQPVAEIFQTRGSYEYYGAPRMAKRTINGPSSFLQDAWAKDIVIGVIASPDHGGGYGKACVFAPELTREAILDALRARHCYGTTAAKIFLDVRVNGHLMGEKMAEPPGKTVKVSISARCPAPISRIEVCRNNKYIWSTRPDGASAQVTFVDPKPLEGASYYYVRLIQQDEEIAWTSPVWFGADPADTRTSFGSSSHTHGEHPHVHARN